MYSLIVHVIATQPRWNIGGSYGMKQYYVVLSSVKGRELCLLPPRFTYHREAASLRKLKFIIFYWAQKFKLHDRTHQSAKLRSKQTTGKKKLKSDNGNTWSWHILRSVRASLKQYLSTTKLFLRDNLTFFCFVITADFSLRLKLLEQQGKLQFRRRNDWIWQTRDQTANLLEHTLLPSHEVDIFYPKKCRAHFLSWDRLNIIIGWTENLFH